MPEEIKPNPTQTISPEDVIYAERKRLNLQIQGAVTGLAVSGGGIRSASFGLGVMQALVANNQFSKIDYMSTVSGGGYLGSALTWALKQGGKDAGLTPDNFPLGKRGTHRDKDTVLKNNPVDEEDNKLLDFIRQHGSYLAPTSSLDIVSLGAVILRSIVMSLFVYIGLLTVTMTTALWLLYQLNRLALNYSHGFFLGVKEFRYGVMLVAGVLFLVVILIRGFLYSLSTFLSNSNANKYRYTRFIKGQVSIGLLLKIGLTCFVFGSLPYVSMWLGKGVAELTASSSTLFGTLVGLWQYKKAQQKEHNTGTVSDIMIYAGAVALFYGVLLFAYLATTKIFLNELYNVAEPLWLFALVTITIIFGYFTNLNLIGPHHMWRNRLMEAFMPNKAAVETNCWMPATEADSALVKDMCDEFNPRPYHIINTNVILSNSPKVDYSGRGGDNFIISPLYCGCDATGWKLTEQFQVNKTRSGISLATAMATSAAALNPNAAVSGEGFTRNVVVSMLLSLLNLRLGFWTSNPSMENTVGSPNFFNPGLTSELFRTGLSETNRNLQLSDGGHYENLALYELVRRKLDLIIVSDGGADLAFNFDDLANAVEKVRVDFGAKISFIKDYQVECILPGTAGSGDFQKKYNIAKHGFAIADIFYADGTKGTLVYLKLAMIEDMSTDVFSYKGVNPAFPHQSTSDQFFNEKQFEAYRELGYYITWQMMESEKGKEIFT